ncbi:glycosyltransferase family A protein [Dokdonia sp.]|uniref:glycosyltransferase n=1 Tax=Dokdonia sp. TaxID=2024995 RepID=UPI0032640DBA
MNIQIVIPVYNEADHLTQALQSFVEQTLLPQKIIIINDGSTDESQKIIDTFSSNYSFFESIQIPSEQKHLPGSKVINAFYEGFALVNSSYDLIGKFDADIILPKNYFEVVSQFFKKNKKTGIAGGNLYIKKNNNWEFEAISEKTKVRGPIKLYRKACFEDIGGLKKSIGWDTVDGLLAQYHGWTIETDTTLHVKHLKPTGKTYTKEAKYKQGEAFYRMQYGFLLTTIAATKLALRKRKIVLFFDYIRGFFRAKRNKQEFLVTKAEGTFIRKLRWKGIWSKITM